VPPPLKEDIMSNFLMEAKNTKDPCLKIIIWARLIFSTPPLIPPIKIPPPALNPRH